MISVKTCTTITAGTSTNQLWSYDQRFNLVMQTDGNLVLYQPGYQAQGSGTALWSSNTAHQGVNGGANNYAVMDGRLCVHDGNGAYLWCTNNLEPANYLSVQTDGNPVLYEAGGQGQEVWTSNTCCH
jgi:hypothetical protein